MSQKKRLLICNDAHFLFSGYGKYGHEVLSRLADTGKYRIAELACYGQVADPRCKEVPWTYYPNAVDEKHPFYSKYKSSPDNELGAWRFERTCLDFKPDIVFDIRDPWMFAFETSSPYRDFYHLAIMPTVDSHPQQDGWIDMFSGADGVLTYSDYGKRVLEDEGNGSISVSDVASPGVDLDTFSPVQNKGELKRRMGLQEDANIIGTIMRNQKRKLYPDLFQAFKKFIDICYETGRKDLADKTFLYIHCSYPDKGWNIPSLLKEYELSSKVIFSYICDKCKGISCNLFRGPRTVCNQCNAISCTLPNTQAGLTPEQLAMVLNSFDVYIQYAVCEGFGMPQVEAAACGVPVMTVDYSAMQDIINKCHGIALPVKNMYRDTGTDSYRAMPDNDATAKIIFDFFSSPFEMRRMRGNKARKAAEKYYNWDRTAKIWENYFDNVELTGPQGKWDSKITKMHDIPSSIPEHVKKYNKSLFTKWIITNVLQEPKDLSSRFFSKTLNDLNFGASKHGNDIKVFNKEAFFHMASERAFGKIEAEMIRTKQIDLQELDFIKFAHERDRYLSIS